MNRVFVFVAVWLWALPTWAAEAAWQQAYVEQNIRFIAGHTEAPAGFKAGLSNAASQQRFGSDRTVYGSLSAAGQRASGERVALADFSRGMVELELAFQLNQAVEAPIASVAELQSIVRRVAIALELPDLALLPASPTAKEIVRANVAGKYFVIGNGVSPQGLDLDALPLRLFRDASMIAQSYGGGVSGGQWQALLALVNQRVAMGWRITPQQWLLTGALGGMNALEPGYYHAESVALGGVAITVY